MLDTKQVYDLAGDLLKIRTAEMERLNRVYSYLRGGQPLPAVPTGVPDEVRRLAKMSRVNMIRLVIDVPAQSLYVSGYKATGAEDDSPAWDTWQANQLDARQTGVHRAALAYGAAYVSVLPGDTSPVMRGFSPRKATCFYGSDDLWPRYALETRPRLGDKNVYRLFDDEAAYTFIEDTAGPRVIGAPQVHGLGVTPFVRFRNLLDLDDDQVGEVEPLMPLQDQIDFTTFGLLVAQHYQSFRQRYIIGWTADDETEKAKAGAARMLTFDDDNVTIGEFGEVNLTGYLDSREATLQHLATISQTPPHHLLGKLVNLSAEALVAAESGQRRKIAEREITFGEAWEQALGLAARAGGERRTRRAGALAGHRGPLVRGDGRRAREDRADARRARRGAVGEDPRRHADRRRVVEEARRRGQRARVAQQPARPAVAAGAARTGAAAAGSVTTLAEQHRIQQLALRAVMIRQILAIWPAYDENEHRRHVACRAGVAHRARVAPPQPVVCSRRPLLPGRALRRRDPRRRADRAGGPAAARADRHVARVPRPLHADEASGARPPQRRRRRARRRHRRRHSPRARRRTRDAHPDDPDRPTRARLRARHLRHACDFCEMLADRGAVYGEASADFEAHDHCSCSAEPVFA
jgi:hypothetical protein